MRLNERLNLVIPVYDDHDKLVGHVHSTPVSLATFEVNHAIVARTFTSLFSSGYGEVAGPRVAAMIMRSLAKRYGDDAEEFIGEVVRLSRYVHGAAKGWETLPLEDAIAEGVLTDEDASEVINAIVFFTVASAMLPRKTVNSTIASAARIWNASTSSLEFTAWVTSLRTSTKAVASKKTVAPPTEHAVEPAGLQVMKDGLTSTLQVPS
jgi:hypothetical protein